MYKIIDESIYSDLTKIAKSEGFDSVEAWQKNNTLKVPHKPFHAGRPRENIIRSAPFTIGTIHRKNKKCKRAFFCFIYKLF